MVLFEKTQKITYIYNMRSILFLNLFLLIIYNIPQAKSEYLSTIPNSAYVNLGQKTSCQICHEHSAPSTSTSQLNGFGSDYRTCGRSWNTCVAHLDSDNDGFDNDVELNCTNYSWIAGSDVCGTTYLRASNPGDASSKPTISVESRADPVPGKDSLSATPNPFNPCTRIVFQTKAGSGVLTILDLNGRLIKQYRLADTDLLKGYVLWDGTDKLSHPIAGGVYLARLTTKDSHITKKLVLSR